MGQGNDKSKATFGGYDVERFGRGEMYWHNLVNYDYWTLNLTGAALGGKKIHASVDKVIIDTGTSFFLMPNDDFEEIASHFSN